MVFTISATQIHLILAACHISIAFAKRHGGTDGHTERRMDRQTKRVIEMPRPHLMIYEKLQE